jgi:hypothetical protein
MEAHEAFKAIFRAFGERSNIPSVRAGTVYICIHADVLSVYDWLIAGMACLPSAATCLEPPFRSAYSAACRMCLRNKGT